MAGKQKKGHTTGGSKTRQRSDQWQSKVSKLVEGSGLIRETKKADAVVERQFKVIDKCCNLECFRNVDASSQRYLFDDFWKRGKSKQIQDLNIASCLKKVDVMKQTDNPTHSRRPNQWKYHVRLGSVDVRVCLAFLITLYQLSNKRIRVIQQKILRGETSFHEKRGHHSNRPHRTPLHIIPFIKEHLSLISFDEMLYVPARGSKIPHVDFKKLYDHFCQYYENTTGKSAPITCRMYKTLYKSNYSDENTSDCSAVEVVVLPMEDESLQNYRSQSLSSCLAGELSQPGQAQNDPLASFTIHELPQIDEVSPPNEVLSFDGFHTISKPSIPAIEPPVDRDTTEPTSSANAQSRKDDTLESSTPRVNEFIPMDRCCAQKCYQKLDSSSQRYLHDEFSKLAESKQLQDLYLASRLKKMDIVRHTANSMKPQRQVWNYFVHLGSVDVRVCFSFITNLYGVSQKRLRIIQSRILQGDTSFLERRGRTVPKKKRIPAKVVPLMKKHMLLLPHYKTNGRKYFENPDIDLKKLFQAFCQYYQEQTGAVLSIPFRTYSKLFQINSDIRFTIDCINECSICAPFNATVFPTEPQLKAQLAHEEVSNAYLAFKDNLVEQAKAGEILMIEFDYLPYICVPRLNVIQGLYKQLPFLYSFNVHNYCDDSSYMYLFPESKSARDVDPVISFIFATIQPILESKSSYQRVVLLCNNCQGQSKNISLVRFCSWMSVIHNIPFRQIFPIPGHSTSICSQNFAQFWAKNKKRKTILSVKPIIIDMVTARPHPSPFIVFYNSPIIERWAEALSRFFFTQPKQVNGHKFNLISYEQLEHIGGNMYANTTFHSDPQFWIEFTHLIQNLELRNIVLKPSVPPGVNSAKRQNVFSFFHLFTSDEIIKFQESFAV